MEVNEENSQNKKSMVYPFLSLAVSILAILLLFISYNNRTRHPDIITFHENEISGIVNEGDVVSLDKYGKLRQGAGTTIYRNIQEIRNKTLYHLHTVVVGEIIHVAQYDSEMLVTVVDPNTDDVIATETFPLPLIDGKPHRVDDLIVLQDNIVLSFGDNHAIPARVDFIEGKIEVEFGEYSTPYQVKTIQPEIMNLNQSCVICSYYGFKNMITAVAGCLRDGLQMEWGENVVYSEDYIFHDIAGYSGEKFIVTHARVPWFEGKADSLEGQKNSDNRIRYGLGTVHPNLTVSFAPIKILEIDSFGFMDMTTLDENTTVLSFINESNNNGMTSILFHYDIEKDDITVGSMIHHQRGGGSRTIGGLYSFIHVRAFSPRRFGLYYSDMAAGATTALSLVDVTSAYDLVPFGPEIILTPPTSINPTAYFWTNLAPTTHNRFFIMESLTIKKGDDEPHASIHVGEIYNDPIGIVSSFISDKASVTVGGIVKVKGMKLTPGKEYLGNSNGQLVEGDYAGQINSESYPVYTQQGSRLQIVTTANQVGIAISENELFIHIPSYNDA